MHPPAPGAALTPVTGDAGLSADPALSPDGRFVAYASDRAADGSLDIWLQPIGGGSPLRLTRDPADDSEPAFSPDGEKIAFRSERDGGGIYVVPAAGGEAHLLAAEGRGPRFSPDGAMVAYWRGNAGSATMCVISSTGGESIPLERNFASARYPVWLDGTHLLFAGARTAAERSGWWVASLEGFPAARCGALEIIRAQGLEPVEGAWTAERNRIVFSARAAGGISLWRFTMNRDWQMTTPPRRLTFGTGDAVDPSACGGRLSFTGANSAVRVWSLAVDANRGIALGEPQPVTRGLNDSIQASLSADGRRLAFVSMGAASYDIWLKDLPAGRQAPLMETPDSEYGPAVSPDGSRIAYHIQVAQRRATYVMDAVGGLPAKVCDDCGFVSSWSPDGGKILYTIGAGQARRTIGQLDLKSGGKAEILRHPRYSLYQPVFSPDGKWIAFYARINPSQSQIFVAPLLSGNENDWVPVTDGAAADMGPRWAPDGNLLYFFSERDRFRCIWAQRLDPASKRPAAAAFAVEHFHSARRPLLNVRLNALGLAVGPDKIVFNLAETTGNVWLADLTKGE